MSTKPTDVVEWATDGGATQVEPDSGDKETGFVPATPADPQHVNWLIATLGLWSVYLRDGVLDGPFSLKAFLTPATITGSQDNYAPTGHADAVVIRQGLTGNATLTGLAGPGDGRIVVLVNLSDTYYLKLDHDVTSTAENRFQLPQDKDLYLIGEMSYAVLWYDTTLDRWTVIATNGRQEKQRWISGSDFKPADSADAANRVYDNGAILNTTASPTGFSADFSFDVGTIITDVHFYMQLGSVSYSRQISLTRGTVPSSGSGTTIGSGTLSGTSVADDDSISGMPHTILSTGPYVLECAMEDNDLCWGAMVTYI